MKANADESKRPSAWCADANGLPRASHALRSHNLPAPPSPLVGREDDVARVMTAVRQDGVRLVTLTGPGGVGKTRVALAAAATLVEGFPDGVWFVPLGAVADASLLPSTMAQAIGLRERGGRAVVERLLAELAPRDLLLVLDGFEPFVAAAPLVADLLAAAPGLRVLVTSRARLRLRGEHDLPLDPLAMPKVAAGSALADVSASAAVQLFVARAREADPNFSLTPANAEAVVAICRRLDGLPLAIELAAARSRLLDPAALLARLDRRLPLLTGGSRDLPERQRTLRDAIGWSYDALDPSLQRLFGRLAVFVGGYALDDVDGVAGGDRGGDTLDEVSALIDVSLLRRETSAGGPRVGMLETIREFGLEQLEAWGEADTARKSHAIHFLLLADEAAMALVGPNQAVWLDRLEQEHANLRAAFDWLLARGDARATTRLAAGLWLFWLIRGHLAEGRQRLAEALAAHPPEPTRSQARALAGAGALAEAQGDYAAAETLLDASLDCSAELGDPGGVGMAQLFRGLVAFDRGDFEGAERLSRDALALAEDGGDRWSGAVALAQLGLVAMRRGDHVAADELERASLERFAAVGNPWGAAMATGNRAVVALDRGDYAATRALLEDALTRFWTLGDLWGVGSYLEVAARAAVQQGQAERGARLLGAATAVREGVGVPLKALFRLGHERNVAASRAQLGEAGFAAAWDAGRALTVPAALALAVAPPATTDIGPIAIAATTPPTDLAQVARLTPRELDVLRLLVEGHSDRTIADALYIGHRTVATHVANLLAKLEVSSRTAAAARAVRAGIA